MKIVPGALCTMCCFGISTKKVFRCRECGGTFCPHLCSEKRYDFNHGRTVVSQTAVCHSCLGKRKEGVK